MDEATKERCISSVTFVNESACHERAAQNPEIKTDLSLPHSFAKLLGIGNWRSTRSRAQRKPLARNAMHTGRTARIEIRQVLFQRSVAAMATQTARSRAEGTDPSRE